MIAIDCETTGIDLYHTARPFFVTICDEQNNVSFWEWSVNPLTRQPVVPPEDLAEIRDMVVNADIVIGQNIKFDYTALSMVYDDMDWWDWSKVQDTLIAGHLLRSNQPHDLTSMALVYLRINIQPLEDSLERAVKSAKTICKRKDNADVYGAWRLAEKGLAEMPSAKESVWKYDCWLPRILAKSEEYEDTHPWYTVLAEYSNADSAATILLFQKQWEMLEKQGLVDIYNERLKLIPISQRMERKGVSLNKPRLRKLQGLFKDESTKSGELCTKIAKDLGYTLILPKSGNNQSLANFVFNGLKLQSSKQTDGGKPSLDKAVLEEWEGTLTGTPLEFIQALRAKRKRDTALTYMDSYERYWLPLNGDDLWFLLHPSLNMTGTDTLRWSTNNPGTQNISKQEGFNLRYAFGPTKGREWWALDYENIELRIPAYESGEKAMIEIFEKPNDPPYFGSYHLLNASIIYPDLFWPLAKEEGAFKKKYAATWYQWVKNFDFAVSYGAVEKSGTADRAAHKAGAQKMVMDHLKEHTKLNRKWITFAEKHGYVETIPDKTVDPKRGYPIYCSRTKWGKILPTVPLNYHVQSTAMWCTSKAMVRCQEYLSTLSDAHMVLQVHDELVFDFPRGRGKEPWRTNLPKVRKLKHLMEQSGEDIGIPLRVAVTYHPETWSEGEKIK